jgi:hypothetical protein
MRIETLKSPGLLSNGIALRSAAAKAISQVEIYTDKIGGAANDKATLLNAFFTDCATKALAGTSADAAAPTVSSRTQTFTEQVIVITYNEPLALVVPDKSAFAITSPARTVTGVEVVGSTVRVSYSGALLVTADSPEIAYTQPSFNRLSDASGNLAASFTAAAVTVAGS